MIMFKSSNTLLIHLTTFLLCAIILGPLKVNANANPHDGHKGEQIGNDKNKGRKKNFFGERYRGWLWFDRREIDDEQLRRKENKEDKMPSLEEMEQAEMENKKFTRELELLRQMMIRYPENIDYVVLYKKKEKEMQNRAGILGINWAIANFKNPDLVDELENPVNMYGRAIKRDEQKRLENERLRKVAKKVDLFVFRKGGCPYCPDLEKHLFSFANRYGFKVEAVSPDNSNSSYFETNHSLEMVKALGLEIMPTVIAIVKDTRERYELARGAVSVADLEEKALLLEKIVFEQEKAKESIKGDLYE